MEGHCDWKLYSRYGEFSSMKHSSSFTERHPQVGDCIVIQFGTSSFAVMIPELHHGFLAY